MTAAPPAPPRRGGRLARTAALVAIGFLLTVAYQQAMADEPGTSRARGDLAADVRLRQRQVDDLRHDADRLRDGVDRARERALAGGGEATRLRELTAGTGLGKVTGDGAVVRVADAPPRVDPVTGAQDPDDQGLVLDRDLQDLANALWQAGAEAIAINGQRLTAVTSIRQAGGVILVDFQPVTSPYELAAVGPGELVQRFERSPTATRFHRYVEEYRMRFAVREQDGLVLPAAPGPRLRFAHPPSPAPASPPPPTGGPR